MHYIFHQLGAIPGIPGTFGNCRVDIDEEGNLTETPLALVASEPSGEVASAEEVPPGIEETVQQEEPVAPTPAPHSTSTSNGG